MGLRKGQVNSSFWKNKKVFLTGHTGFKGTWLSLWLQSMGAIVKGYSLNLIQYQIYLQKLALVKIWIQKLEI